MGENAKKVLAAALRLSPKSRAAIASRLIESLDAAEAEDPAVVAAAWDKEIARRIADLKAGKVKLIPWEKSRFRSRSR